MKRNKARSINQGVCGTVQKLGKRNQKARANKNPCAKNETAYNKQKKRYKVRHRNKTAGTAGKGGIYNPHVV